MWKLWKTRTAIEKDCSTFVYCFCFVEKYVGFSVVFAQKMRFLFFLRRIPEDEVFQVFSVCFSDFPTFSLFKNFVFSAGMAGISFRSADFFGIFIALYKIFDYQQIDQNGKFFWITDGIGDVDGMLISFSPAFPKTGGVDFFSENFRVFHVFFLRGGSFLRIFCTFQKAAVDISKFSGVFPHGLHHVFHSLWKRLLKTCILCPDSVETDGENWKNPLILS